MNPSLKKIFRQVSLLTVCITGAALLLAALFWPQPARWMALAGIVYGAFLGMIGFYLICSMAASLTPHAADAKKKGALSYAGRYVLYAIALFGGAFAGMPPLAMLAGILCSKLALAGIALAGRKDT